MKWEWDWSCVLEEELEECLAVYYTFLCYAQGISKVTPMLRESGTSSVLRLHVEKNYNSCTIGPSRRRLCLLHTTLILKSTQSTIRATCIATLCIGLHIFYMLESSLILFSIWPKSKSGSMKASIELNLPASDPLRLPSPAHLVSCFSFFMTTGLGSNLPLCCGVLTTLQGGAGGRGPGLGRHWFLAFHSLPKSAWAAGNLGCGALQDDGTFKSKSTQPRSTTSCPHPVYSL